MKMKVLMFLVLLGIQDSAAVTHSLQYFSTASSGIPGFPEFVSLGMVDGVQIVYYDSNIRRVIPKQDWMDQNEGPEYWRSQTQTSIGSEQFFKANIQIAKQRFNQTGGVHIFQNMYGCEWDDETDKVVKVYEQYGYDGEDFISLDLKEETWAAPTPQAVITKQKWDRDRAFMAQKKNYLTQICPNWLKKYVNYGRSSLMRTELPSVSLLQKSASSPVSCHATGFYPNRAELFWRKDGDEIHEGVVKGEVLPNNDGTFQMSADLKLSSVPTEDWGRYECVFQLLGAEDLATQLDKTKIKTNAGSNLTIMIVCIIAAVVLGVIVVIGFVLYKKKNAKRPPPCEKSKTSSSTSDFSSTESLSCPSEESHALSKDSVLSSTGSADSVTPLMKSLFGHKFSSTSHLMSSLAMHRGKKRLECLSHPLHSSSEPAFTCYLLT
ncbi:class I histocompatibility antigen, F10 alpha chain-like isoform 2-T2 [Odontesthes bonariensis]|uniref:class I histocompatibility antigen, F10 alpha chain-like isoform X2 n=1 Tax=Odontesthes bonariensis TaxID=219752 RepID=UPI003F581DF1